MRPLMTRFCVFYSLEAGVVCLCIASIVVSGGLICNHKFQVPIQIREWRNQTIYTEENLKIVDLFDDISIWVLVGDVLFTLLMLFPAALTKRETPWEKRNSARKILIPCIVIKILVILYHMVLFVWVAWKLHAKCPEIIGILLAFALYVLLGWYLIVVVISFYFELGMRLTFHKLQPSARSSVQQSQKSSISQQEQAVVSDEKIQIGHIEEDEKESLRKIDNDDNGYSNDMYFKKQKETTYKSSNRTLDDQDRNGDAEAQKPNERRPHKNPEKRSHSSQEIIDGKRYASTERLKSNAKDKEVEDREEQYRKLLNKSQVSLDSLDGRQTKKEKGRSQEKFQQLGPDNMKYRVSERKNADGEGKRRYYYKTDKKGKQENDRRESEDSHDSKERRPAPPKYRSPRQDSEDSHESQGRRLNKKPRSPPHRESDGSHESQSRQRYDPARNRPRRESDDSQVSQRQFRYPPPPASPPHRESDHSHDSQNQGRMRYPPPGQPARDASDNEEGYRRSRDAPPQYDDRRPYYNRPRYDHDDDDDDDDYDGQARIPLRSTHTRPEIEERSYQRIPRYEDDDSHYDDRGYNDRREGHDYDDADSDEYPERYGKVPPYRETVDEDGYISSEV